jgi:hypothetical protein
MKKPNKALAAALALGMVCSFSPVLAAEEEKDGTVDIVLSYEEAPVTGTFDVYYIADANVLDENTIAYTYADAFVDCPADLELWQSDTTANTIEAYALDTNAIPVEELYVDGENSIALDQGLYLFVQSDDANETSTQFFLVSVPMWDDEQEILNFTIKAEPKTSKKTTTTSTSKKEETTSKKKGGKSASTNKGGSVNTAQTENWSIYAALLCFTAGIAVLLVKGLKLQRGK